MIASTGIGLLAFSAVVYLLGLDLNGGLVGLNFHWSRICARWAAASGIALIGISVMIQLIGVMP